MLGGWRILPGVCAAVAFVSCISGILFGLAVQPEIGGAKSNQFFPVEELWLFSGAVADILIACSMAYLVRLEL